MFSHVRVFQAFDLVVYGSRSADFGSFGGRVMFRICCKLGVEFRAGGFVIELFYTMIDNATFRAVAGFISRRCHKYQQTMITLGCCVLQTCCKRDGGTLKPSCSEELRWRRINEY